MARELEVVVAEVPALGEEDDHEPSGGLPRRRDRHGEERGAADLLRQRLPVALEALVRRNRGRGEDASLGRRGMQGASGSWETALERAGQDGRDVVRADELQSSRSAARHQHGREGAAERLGRGERDRVQRLDEGERRAEHGGDAVEAALDARLARALLEGVRVPDGERGEAGERVEDVGVVGLERARAAAAADADHAQRPGGSGHRRHDRVREAGVGVMRNRTLDARVVGGDDGPAALDRLRGGTPARGELEADELRGHSVHGDTAQDAAAGVEEIAVGGVRVEELGDLVDEALEHGLEAQLRGERLGGAEERGLLLEPPLAVHGPRLRLRVPREARVLEGGAYAGGELRGLDELVGCERAVALGREHDEDRNDAGVRNHWDVGGALRAEGRDQPRAHAFRGDGVVNRERCRVEDGARDAGRLVLEVEPDVAEAGAVGAALAREEAAGRARFVVDEHARDRVRVQRFRDRVECVCDGRVGSVHRRRLPLGALLLGTGRDPRAPVRRLPAVAPAGEEAEPRHSRERKDRFAARTHWAIR